MFSGEGIENANGTEWYFPQRLTDDTGAVDNGNANPAQSVLDVDATMVRGTKMSIAPLEGSLQLRILDRWRWMPLIRGGSGAAERR